MAKTNKKQLRRTLMAVHQYLSDPEKLQTLCLMADLDPDTLLATVEQDYATLQPLAHPGIYEARGAEKGGQLILILQQCKMLAEGYEKKEDAGGHLARTLQHVQAHVAVLMADYEEQLRQARNSE
ncbi:hypothetical protein [Hymenobacter sp. YC55]|uniref:hypothetical protein n=1 Tax=Hymenobacter sp. YC55 TaxID=3034019 RepID=UPI0023F9E5FB|nr:hypothetical protein [Hymenobacter sp. YC55]MDF7815356.1 hypothetical protein [Hymenobacter sp. YC55]